MIVYWYFKLTKLWKKSLLPFREATATNGSTATNGNQRQPNNTQPTNGSVTAPDGNDKV